MAQLGSNIAAGGKIPVEALAALQLKSVRVVAHQAIDDSAYFDQLRQHDIRIWLVLAHESFDGFGGWAEAIDEYARRYGDRIAVWEAGNEPDILSDSSWTLAHGTYSDLLLTARDRLGSNAYICAGGLASGRPDWLGGADPAWMEKGDAAPADYDQSKHGQPVQLQWVNAVAIHPYGQCPDERFDFDPDWYFGRVTNLLAQYRQWLDANRPDKALHVSEWGAPVDDFEGGARGDERPFEDVSDYLRERRRIRVEDPSRGLYSQEALERHGRYMGNVAQTLLDTDLVGDAIHFCYGAMVDPFGATDEDFNHRPAYDALLAAVTTA